MSGGKPDPALARLRAQRQSWLELEPAADGHPAREVCVQRPRDTELGGLASGDRLEFVVSCVTAWRGITEARLWAGGGEREVDFSRELWDEVVRDNTDWATRVLERIVELVNARLEQRKVAQGN